jgi:redox-sensing transcriptional repressor
MDIDITLSNSPFEKPRPPLSIPQASLKRLPQYHHYLVDCAAKGILQVSCSLIGRDLGCVPVQVRKDIQYTGIVGKPKTGYSVLELIQAIETFLGWNNVNEAFLVGAGNLGKSLLGHERFSKFGLRIVAAFDTDPDKVGQWIYEKAVLPLEDMAGLAQRMSIHLGILTAPAEAAQAVADEMVKAGILAIWNFAPVKLNVPQHIFVHNEDLYSSLASLSWKLARRFQVPIQEGAARVLAESISPPNL